MSMHHGNSALDESLARLREPDPARARWLIVKNPKEGTSRAQVIAYYAKSDVEELLDEVIGPSRWKKNYHSMGAFVLCTLAIRGEDGEWIEKTDGTGDDVDAEKSAADGRLDTDLKSLLSDAFKRAAFCWGIGRWLAKLPKPWVDVRPPWPGSKSWVIADHEYARLNEIAATGIDPGERRHEQRREEHREEPRAQTSREDTRGSRAPSAEGTRRAPPQQNDKLNVIPFGKTKGMPIAEATSEDLRGAITYMSKNPRNPEFAKAWIANAERELAHRKEAGMADAGRRA